MRFTALCYPLLMGSLPMSTLGAEPDPAGPRIATKEEYLACLEAGDSIERRSADLADRDRKHKEMAARFQEAEADLASQVRKHAPATRSEVDSYNKAVAKRNASAASFNLESRNLQLERRALNTVIVATNAKCGGIMVSEEDAHAATEQRKLKGKSK